MNTTYGSYGGNYGGGVSDYLTTAANWWGKQFEAAVPGSTTALQRVATVATEAYEKEKHAVWCRLHPVDCFFEKRPWAKPVIIGGGVLLAVLWMRTLYRFQKRQVAIGRSMAESGFLGPEGMAIAHALKTKRANGRRRKRKHARR